MDRWHCPFCEAKRDMRKIVHEDDITGVKKHLFECYSCGLTHTEEELIYAAQNAEIASGWQGEALTTWTPDPADRGYDPPPGSND